jgi:hypothetical protein
MGIIELRRSRDGIAQTEFHRLVFWEFPWSFELNFDLNV